MKSMILIFIILALSCSREPLGFVGDDDDFDTGSNGDNDNDSDTSSDSIDTETETGTDTDTDTDTSTSNDVDSGTDKDTDTNGDTDTETETSSGTDTDGDTDSDTGTDTETESATEHDSDTETATDTETETSTEDTQCPWECKPIAGAIDVYHVCDQYPESPQVVQNWNFKCNDGEYCCQPIGATEAGALTVYCQDEGFQCTEASWCSEGNTHSEFYCNSSSKICCEL